jgi:hypothetical protein
LSDATLQLYAAALLHDVRGLVRRGVEARGEGERDMVPGRVRLGPDRAARGCCRVADVRLDATDVVPSEQALDRVGMRQRTARAGDALRRGVLDGAGFRVGGDRRRTSGALNLNLLDERPLAGAELGEIAPREPRCAPAPCR